jgi:diphthine-ammonia ligase
LKIGRLPPWLSSVIIAGVSAGAINSTYQKVRVEDVCRRLGLTPLCYLWEVDQLSLFDEMIGAGVDAVIIKVAAMGLDVRHLGMTLKQVGNLSPPFRSTSSPFF